VRFGEFTLDADRRQLARDDAEVHLTPKAFDLLWLLVSEAPRVVGKAELHERLWPGTFVSDATLVGLVKEVRRALDDRDPSAPIVRTVHGVGYGFARPLDQPAASGSVDAVCWIVMGRRHVPLWEGANLIGRDPTAAVVLDAKGVSRRHAQVVVGARGAVLEDLGSKNGTRVGDATVTESVALRDGDEIRIGPVVLVYHASESKLPTDTLDLGNE
jgi:DNA-binding winged helix-turn-helix (wHTH) protein